MTSYFKLPRLVLSLAIAFSSFAFTSCSSSSSSNTSVSGAQGRRLPTKHEQEVAIRLFNLINAERALHGRSRLSGNHILNRMAQNHSEYLATKAIASGDNSHMGIKVRSRYVNLRYGIENLNEITYAAPASSNDPAGDAIKAWKQSYAKRNQVNQTWTLVGVGVYRAGNGVHYITVLLAIQTEGLPRSLRSSIMH